MEFVVAGALVLLFASFVYRPLGRSMRNAGRKVEDQQRAARHRPLVSTPSERPLQDLQTGAAIPPVQFGRRKSIEEPRRPETRPSGQIFDKSLFEGEMGQFLREAGYAPDDPHNQAVNVQPVSVLLAEDEAQMRRATEALNGVARFPILPWLLLPMELWRGDFGPWLRQHLDLSPCRPWNVIFLPADQTGAKALGLPVAPPPVTTVSKETTAMVAIIAETYAGRNPPEGEAVKLMLASIRSNSPELFPADIGDFSERVREARADMRALAFATAATGDAIDGEAIGKSQMAFLEKPGEQLVA